MALELRLDPRPAVMIRLFPAVLDPVRGRRYGVPLLLFFMASPAWAALIQDFSEPTTVTVTSRTQLFEELTPFRPDGVELSTASVVLSESDEGSSAAAVLPRGRRQVDGAAGSELTTASADLGATGRRLPARADRSTTAAQAVQLLRFERRNQIAEAFLLARDLVARDPGDEFALDAAIRTSLVLGRAGDVEDLYRQAIQRARLPGKYYVQLAHWYLRTGQDEKLKALLSGFEKNAPRDGEYLLTLARMRVIAEDTDALRAAVGQVSAGKSGKALFPLVMLSARLYRTLGEPEKAIAVLQEASGQDFGPWERRAQLIEFLKLPGLTPEAVLHMVEAALVNEPSYARARTLADRILDRAVEERIFFPLRQILVEKIADDNASDIERWLVALMYQREGDEEGSLKLLQGGLPADALTTLTAGEGDEETTEARHVSEDDFMGGTTPVIAYERALALAKAGRHGEAAEIASNLLAEQPVDWTVRLFLAEQQLAMGEAAVALKTVSAWSGRQRMDAAARLRRAQVSISAAMALDNAATLVDVWLDLSANPSFEELQAMDRAVASALTNEPGSGNGGKAATVPFRERVEQAVEARDPRPGEGISLWLLRARLAARDGDRGAELRHYLRYLERDPENTAMLRYVADLAARYANVPLELQSGGGNAATLRATDTAAAEIALLLYRRLLELQPQAPSNYAALMRIYLMRGEAETAKRVAAELVERETSSTEALDTAARILHENGFAAESLPYYRPLVMGSPEDFELWARFANALRAAGKPELAQPILRRILEEGLYGRSFAQDQVIAALVVSARETGTLPQLADYFDSLRSSDLPEKPAFFVTAARVLAEAGLPERAEAFLTDFERLYPENSLLPVAMLLAARIKVAAHGADALGELLDHADRFTTSPEAVTALLEAAELQHRAGRAGEALELLEQIAVSYPDDDRAQGALVRGAIIAATDLNDSARAAGLLNRFLSSGTLNFELRQEARSQLQKLKR